MGEWRTPEGFIDNHELICDTVCMLKEVTREEFSQAVRLHSGSLSLFPWGWRKSTSPDGTKTTTYTDYKKRTVAKVVHKKQRLDTRIISRYELETDIDSA